MKNWKRDFSYWVQVDPKFTIAAYIAVQILAIIGPWAWFDNFRYAMEYGVFVWALDVVAFIVALLATALGAFSLYIIAVLILGYADQDFRDRSNKGGIEIRRNALEDIFHEWKRGAQERFGVLWQYEFFDFFWSQVGKADRQFALDLFSNEIKNRKLTPLAVFDYIYARDNGHPGKAPFRHRLLHNRVYEMERLYQGEDERVLVIATLDERLDESLKLIGEINGLYDRDKGHYCEVILHNLTFKIYPSLLLLDYDAKYDIEREKLEVHSEVAINRFTESMDAIAVIFAHLRGEPMWYLLRKEEQDGGLDQNLAFLKEEVMKTNIWNQFSNNKLIRTIEEAQETLEHDEENDHIGE